MKTVAVLGGGPAGSFAAERLARAGCRIRIFDEKLAWEKPCGGGLTFKAYRDYPFLLENATPKKIVRDTFLAAPSAGTAKLPLDQPLVIYSRLDLNRMLLDRAAHSGAQIEQTRVLGVERKGSGWSIRTRQGEDLADYCVIAMGGRNPLRDFGTKFLGADTACALGYFVDSDQDHIDVQFLANLEGYIWVFPRLGHLSVGICGKGEASQSLRIRLEQYMDEKGIPYKGARFFGHVLPSLETPSWRANRIAGDGWMAVGDAAGLVDPITGEGLYYAMRSGDLAGQVLLSNAPDKAAAYRSQVRQEFMADLEFGSTIAKRMFQTKFLFKGIPARMIEFTRRSPRFKTIMQDLFAGTQPYAELKSRLFRNVGGFLPEILVNSFLQKMSFTPVADK